MKLAKLGKICLLLAMFFATFGSLTGKIIGISTITLLYNWFILLSFIIFLIGDKLVISITIPKYLQLFLLYIFFHIFVTYTFIYPTDFFKNDVFLTDSAFTNVLRLVVFILFLYVFTRCVNYRFFKSLTLAYSVGFIIVFLVSYSAIKNGFIDMDIDTGGRFTAGSANANSFGLASFMVFILNLYIVRRDFELKHKFNYLLIFFILISLVGIFLSGSRSVFLGLVLMLLFISIKIPGSKRKFKIIISALLLILFFYSISPKTLYETTFNRFRTHSLSGNNGVQESRVLIWANYLNEFPSYFLIGKGFNRELSVNQADNTAIKFQPHNEYLIVLVQFGILGLILYLNAMRLLLRTLFRSSKYILIQQKSNFSYYVIIGLLLCWIFIFLNLGQYQTSREYWLMLAIICSAERIQANNY